MTRMFLIRLFIAWILLDPSTLYSQAVKRKLVWDSKARAYLTAADKPRLHSATERKIITSHSSVWALSSATVPAHWERPRANDLSQRRKQEALFLYPLRNFSYRTYNGTVRTDINDIIERSDFLDREMVENIVLTPRSSGVNTYYINKLRLGTLAFNGEYPQMIVTDSLIIPVAQPLQGAIIGNYRSSAPFLKIVAATIVYESPALVSLIGMQNANVVYSGKDIFLKSVYEGLQSQELAPPPPLIHVAQGNQVNIFHQYTGNTEIILLNRLYARLMHDCLGKLLTASDDWIADQLVNKFQSYRFNKINAAQLSADPATQEAVTQLIKDFDTKYGNYTIRRLRTLNGLQIIASGDINRLPFQPVKYYVVPTRAVVQPLLGDSSIGTIDYTGAGEANLKLIVETETGYDTTKWKAASEILASKGLVLQPRLQESTIRISEQPLKINGSTVGKIIPVSNRLLRLELNISEGATSIARWFPRDGHAMFNLDVTLEGNNETLSQPVELYLDSISTQRLDYQEPLKSFQVIERNSLTGEIKISSNLSAARAEEGALNYAEVLVDLQFPEKSVLYGPYRLSAYNTLAAEKIFPFIRHADNFKIMVYGRAVYDNGEINVKPFESPSLIIALDDAALMK